MPLRPARYCSLLAGACAFSWATAALAQDAVPTAAAPPSPSLLRQLSDETRAAYEAVRPGLVGVQLAPIAASGSTRPAGMAMGICLDEPGHVLLPVWIDPATLPKDGPRDDAAKPSLKVWSADGTAGTAAFVGSDPKTRLTLLRLEGPLAGRVHAVPRCDGPPEKGSLAILLPGMADAGRLCVWTGGRRDKALVLNADGEVAGFARDGQFLDLADLGPILDALKRDGRVDRPTFGMGVSEVRPDFGHTAHADAPPGRGSLRVEAVAAGSPAAAAGLKPGDYLLKIAGRNVPDMTAFAVAVVGRGGSTELTVHRDGEAVTLTADLPQVEE